jgi:hypothetical protein
MRGKLEKTNADAPSDGGVMMNSMLMPHECGFNVRVEGGFEGV